jgi:hypothetical protein
MGKKKKKKFKSRQNPSLNASASGTGMPNMVANTSAPTTMAAPVQPTTPLPVAPTASAVIKPVANPVAKSSGAYSAHRVEYQNIQSDLIKVLIINGILFGIVIAMYIISQSNPFLDTLYDRIF